MPHMPAGVTDRTADVWEPLLMIADLAGGDWPRRAREACTAFVDGARDDTETTGTRLLADLQQVFGDADVQSTETILGKLHALEESPWGDWYGKPLNARGLAKLLKPYQVKATQVRIGENTPRGYRRSDLHEAWRSYLPGGSETSTTSATSLASHVLDVADVAHPRQACAVCGEPLDPVLAAAGDTTHPMCDPAEETTVKLSGRPRPFPRPKPEPAPRQCRICLRVTDDLHKGVCRDRAACETRQPALPKE